MRKIVVYSKSGCHLCEKVISELEKLRSDEGFELTTQDITSDPKLYERYRNLIPVVTVDGTVKLAGVALSNSIILKSTLKKAILG
ncbi:MAG: glutaredoxin family protein [Candidatus Bathyarchaeia archaeon]|jgi:glutaredoxin